MIKMLHYNDGKEKFQSHEIYLKEDYFSNAEMDVFSHNPFDVCGYGHTKEAALEDFLEKFKYITNELRAFEKMLVETDVITGNIIEVDCFGKEI